MKFPILLFLAIIGFGAAQTVETTMKPPAWPIGSTTPNPGNFQNSKTTPRPVKSIKQQLQKLAEIAMKVLEGGNSTSGNMTSV
ncbi:hypothetical protein B9Z55_003211 [Caenorhabditis nigoni]|uniref:Uncharacterized protein n=1 Tax=Caenorhabditis nigoni TaxID=1611254 RepID=A0A2G5VP21_9PELO|nr:hypothetical protein B9Z55_003211 [Caenorhabditis nigoni]